MITKENLIFAETDAYLNKIILYAIPLINSLSNAKITELDFIVKKYNAEILSNISLINTFIHFVLNNFNNIQKDVYLEDIIANTLNFRHVTNNALSITELQNIMNLMTNKLEELRVKIETSYDLAANSISIYNNLNVESGLNYNALKEDVPIILKYYEGKLLLLNIISLIQEFSNTKSTSDDNDKSEGYSFIDKINDMIDNYLNILQAKIIFSNQLEEINDACFVANIIYQEYSFAGQDSIDLFLSRKYSKIKEDIIKTLKKHL